MNENPLPSTRLAARYREQAVPQLKEKFHLASVMEVPRILKVVLNMGVGEAAQNAKALEGAVGDMTAISGQKPSVRRARKSIAGFKLRMGAPIGVTVTLRGVRMYEFMDRLFNFSLPRIRDFKGVPTSGFDGRGNYTLGLREQIIFPEVDYDKVDKVRGLDITFVTSTNSNERALELLRTLGMPFRERTS